MTLKIMIKIIIVIKFLFKMMKIIQQVDMVVWLQHILNFHFLLKFQLKQMMDYFFMYHFDKEELYHIKIKKECLLKFKHYIFKEKK